MSLCICVLYNVNSYAQLVEDFSDSDLLSDPIWYGDVDSFIVNQDEQLQLNASDAGSSSIFSAFTTADSMEMSFEFLLDFGPSASNRLRIYLLTEDSLTSADNALFLEIGESGSNDAFGFFETNSGTTNLIKRFDPAVQNNQISASIKIKWFDQDQWIFEFDYSNDGIIDEISQVVHNTQFTGTKYFGINCNYTKSRSAHFYFDNIQVAAFEPDLTPPFISGVGVISTTDIEVLLSEPLRDVSMDIQDYSILPGNVHPSAVEWNQQEPERIKLTFSPELNNPGDYQIHLATVQDLFGNFAFDLNYQFSVLLGEIPEYGDLIINEIHAAPTDATLLPNAEFIELYNRSNKLIDLSEVYLSDPSNTARLKESVLFPDDYIVLFDEKDEALFLAIEKTLSVPNIPSLNNSKDEIVLTNSTGVVLDQVFYTDSWYQDDNKAKGGWSLECIDPLSDCRGQSNWIAASDLRGGTPAGLNSTYMSREIEAIILIGGLEVVDERLIRIEVRSEMDLETITDPTIFRIEPMLDVGHVSVWTENNITIFEIELLDPLQANEIYTLSVGENVMSCSGNAWPAELKYTFGIAQEIHNDDLQISEILFDPPSNASEFIEIYNSSPRIIDLRDVWLLVEGEDNPAELTHLDFRGQILPGQWIVICENPASINNYYHVPYPERVFSVTLPSLPNYQKEILSLITIDVQGDSLLIDRSSYSVDFHNPLLENTKGISLERIRYDRDGMEASNWTSAAISVGGATPTGVNSQTVTTQSSGTNYFSLVSRTFSPDNDGFEDLMLLNYELPESGYIADVRIFTAQGHPVKRLVNNQSIGLKGQFVWHGDDQDGQQARVGIYFICIDAFNIQGKKIEEKLKVVLASQF